MTPGTETELWQDLLATLYGAASDLDGCGTRLPDLISRFTGGSTAALWLTDQSMRPVDLPLTNGATEGAALYAERFYQHDPWSPQFFARNTGAVVRGSDMVDDATLDRSLFYNEFGRHFDLFHQMNTTFCIQGPGPATYCTLSVLRSKGAQAFSDGEVSSLDALVPHLKQAMLLRLQLRGAIAKVRHSTLSGMVEGLRVPACVVSGSGMVVHANEAAEAMDRSCAGVLLRGPSNARTLAAGTGRERQALGAAIAEAASGLPGRVVLLSLADGRTLQASVTPVHPGPDRDRASPGGQALLVLRSLGGAGLSELERLGMQLFGFTPAEAAAAAALAGGGTPQEIADGRGTRVNTVRTLLDRAQSKAGAENLRQLVATLVSLSP